MLSLNPRLARVSMLATALCLTACAAASTPPPLIQTQVIKEVPPAALLDCPPPVIPTTVPNRDAERGVMLTLAEAYERCQGQLNALKAWSKSMEEPGP